jgi:hypothetical protein
MGEKPHYFNSDWIYSPEVNRQRDEDLSRTIQSYWVMAMLTSKNFVNHTLVQRHIPEIGIFSI